VRLTEEAFAQVTELAFLEDKSTSSIVREAIGFYLRDHGKKTLRRSGDERDFSIRVGLDD
jgi:hypothetical protein